MNQSAAAVAAALGEQSPESIAARNRIKDLTDNHFEGEFHNSRIPESLFGNVRTEDLDELYRKTQSIDVGVMTTLQQMWKSRADKLGTGLTQFGPEIWSAMAESWSGAASQAAAQGIIDYVNKAQNMVSATKIVADKVEIVTSAVELTKSNVQPKPDTGWASTVAGWVPGPTWKMDRNRTDAAELATYTVLEQVYQPGIREGDTSQPRIPLAYNPVHDPGTVASVPPPSGWQPGPGGPSPSGGSDPDDGGSPGASGEPGDTTPAGVDQLAALVNQPGLGSGDTTAAGLDATPTSTAPAGLSPDTSTGTGPGSTGSGLGSAVPGGSSSAVPGGPGRSIPGPGTSVPGVGSGVAAAGGGNATTRSGMSGMGGMSPGARGKGDDDKEKGKSAVAEAMVTREHGEELTGMDAEHRPKTVPPVLGE
ncbi:hypothetical protein OG874_03590 [Nocardia sp. NBC_00565]|uniref:hypothetical protein n=1 Tax=Nocardia sp. NBC_00565 TaxID=2975993 RepID=UPI002E81F192|nr:hypothetical protein [Nocardia sp. NBC_00565]WUC04302.1 hypothetical protein OG874_03590 [Nocardia sp. NBC_00565]